MTADRFNLNESCSSCTGIGNPSQVQLKKLAIWFWVTHLRNIIGFKSGRRWQRDRLCSRLAKEHNRDSGISDRHRS